VIFKENASPMCLDHLSLESVQHSKVLKQEVPVVNHSAQSGRILTTESGHWFVEVERRFGYFMETVTKPLPNFSNCIKPFGTFH
jgi:hypothetical protein